MSRSCSVNLLPWASMSWRRGATLSPISSSNMRLASAASSMLRRRRVRDSGFIVVAHSCSGIISPRPCRSGSNKGIGVSCALLLRHHLLNPSSSGSNRRYVLNARTAAFAVDGLSNHKQALALGTLGV